MLVNVIYDNPHRKEHEEYQSSLTDVLESFSSIEIVQVVASLNKSDKAVIKNGYATTTITKNDEWNPGDQANPAVMCEMCQAIDTPIGGNYIMTVSEEECKWIDQIDHFKYHKENQVTVVSKLNEIASLANELCEAWEAEGNLDASTIPAPWPFSTDKSGGLSIDEWASEVSGLAEAYEPATSTSFRNNPSPRREWRDYWKDYTDDLAIPEDWEDVSWHNNELPSFIVNGYHIWMNSPRAEERKENYTSNGWNPDDYEDWRFAVNLYNEEDAEIIYTQCQSEDGSDLFITLDFDELVAFVSKPRV